MSQNNVYEDAINKWGFEAQARQMQEECAELIVAINHYCRHPNPASVSNVIEELVDVHIMTEQLRSAISSEAFDRMFNHKIQRLKERIYDTDK